MIQNQSTKLEYRPDIDGLRAVAVLLVLGFHAFPIWVNAGFVGVDIFFVISGFLISSIIFKGLERGDFSVKEFYARRIARIFPALIVVLVTCLVLGWAVLLSDEYTALGKHTAAGAAFILNFVLWEEQGYFDTAAELKPLLHLWSLGIEEQFYIVWPLLLLLMFKRGWNPLFLILPVVIASLALNAGKARGHTIAAFYLPHTRFWELLIGGVLAYPPIWKKVSSPQMGESSRNAYAFIGLIPMRLLA